MLAPNDLVSIAERVFAKPRPEAAARADKCEIGRVRAATSSSWRLLHQETPPLLPATAPLFGGAPPLPERQITFSRVWTARNVRLAGRRALVAEDGALFLAGPVRTEADLTRVASACADGSEGLILRTQGPLEAQMLGPLSSGARRLSGIGLHLGVAESEQNRPFLLDQFASLLLIAELRPRLDYVLLASPVPELAALLDELGMGALKIFELDQLRGVVCAELLVPVIDRDPAGWVDSATISRLRAFAAGRHAKLGPGIHTEPTKIFLTDVDGADRPVTRAAAERGYQLRGLSGTGLINQALMMAKASFVATDQAEAVTTTLFAASTVPVLDLAGGDPPARLPLLAGAGRAYALGDPEHPEEALARFGGQDQQAA